jgi:hypothetical protein
MLRRDDVSEKAGVTGEPGVGGLDTLLGLAYPDDGGDDRPLGGGGSNRVVSK